MTSKERITKILSFERPDRVGIYDSFCKETLAEWQSQGYPATLSPDEYFGFDFKLFDLHDINLEKNITSPKYRDKFLTLSFSGPFEVISQKNGKLNFLKEFKSNPNKVTNNLRKELDHSTEKINLLLNKGIKFDGAWIWSDLAYKDNLFFSIKDYKKYLFPIHKKLVTFLSSKKMPTIFHSDGKINELIPYFIKAGIKALHPLDCNAGMDVIQLNKSFGKKLVFFGNIDISYINDRVRIKNEAEKKIRIVQDGAFYIYHASQPIWAGTILENYKFLLETVKDFGVYNKC